MDVNEMIMQMRNNPQMAVQFVQLLQQNGILPPGPNMGSQNWNIPTNPMAQMWWNNMFNMGNQNNSQPAQNNQAPPQQQPPASQPQQTENKVSSVRVVKSPNEIKADEILMNGDISLFLQDDLNVVYGKRWTNNGTIDNMVFLREEEPAQNEVGNQTITPVNQINLDVEALMGKISEAIDGKLNQFKQEYLLDKRTSAKSGLNKKGVEENG